MQRIRNNLREKWVGQKYSPRVHLSLAIIILSLASVIPWFFLQQLGGGSILIFCSLFLTCNVLVYCLHRFPQHRKLKFLGFLFFIHSIHHQFFSYESIHVDTKKDWVFVVFPISIILSYCLIIFPLAAATIYTTTNLDVALLAYSAAAFYFLMHESIHLSAHYQLNGFFFNSKLLKRLNSLHQIHHRRGSGPKLGNYNVVIPFADILFGTLRTKNDDV